MITGLLDIEHVERSPSKDVAQVRFRPRETIQFQAGQFVFLQRLDFAYPDGKVMKNAYSIGSSYEEYQETGLFSTIVKKTSEAGMSAYLVQEIVSGDAIQCTGPLGHFVDPAVSDKYLFVSIGSGVTPLVSLYKHLRVARPAAKIVNIYGERKAQDILPSIQELFVDEAERHNFLYLSQEDILPTDRKKGHIQDELSQVYELLEDNNYTAFLCGKPEMVNDLRERLLAQGLDTKQIIFEKY